jgi:ABC-type transport system involved in multi-copper enzyme maturation permease subunit
VLIAVTAATCAAIGINCSANKATTPQAVMASLGGAVIFAIMPFISPLIAFGYFENYGIPALLFNVPMQLGLSYLLILSAARALLARPSPETVRQATPLLPVPMQPIMTTPKLPAYDEAENDDPNRFKRWDMPLAHLLRFENPVLQREVRTRLRLRQSSVGTSSQSNPGCLAALGIFFLFYAFLLIIGDVNLQQFYWSSFSWIWLFGSIVAAATLGSMAFTRERETQMLEPLLLTPLTAWEILWGKVLSPIVVCGYYSLAVLPVLLPCLIHYGEGRMSGGVPWWQVPTTLVVVFASAWFAVSLGAYISWLARYTLVSIATTFGTILVLILILPTFTRPYDPQQTQQANPLFWHPFVALAAVFHDKADPAVAGRDALTGALVVAMAGCLAIGLLGFAMRHGPRAKDRARLKPPQPAV